jgi:hypothetical protein
MSVRINWISHKNPAMKTCFVQNVTARTQLERFASDVGLVVMQGVVKTEIMLMKYNLFVPHSASSNKDRNAVSASNITCLHVAFTSGY